MLDMNTLYLGGILNTGWTTQIKSNVKKSTNQI